jgi:hypothetical protein
MKPIEIHLEELVLHGFEPRDRFRIADALELELARLFTGKGAASAAGPSRRAGALDAGEFRVAKGATAQAIGAQVARSVYGQVAQTPRAKTGRSGR